MMYLKGQKEAIPGLEKREKTPRKSFDTHGNRRRRKEGKAAAEEEEEKERVVKFFL